MGYQMKWFRIFSGLSQDAKLAVVANRAGFRRGEVLAVWMALLDQASLASPRGSVKDVDAEEIAATLQCETAPVASVIAALRERNLILPDGMLAGWDKYYEAVSTPRTRAYRARKAAATVNAAAVRREKVSA